MSPTNGDKYIFSWLWKLTYSIYFLWLSTSNGTFFRCPLYSRQTEQYRCRFYSCVLRLFRSAVVDTWRRSQLVAPDVAAVQHGWPSARWSVSDERQSAVSDELSHVSLPRTARRRYPLCRLPATTSERCINQPLTGHGQSVYIGLYAWYIYDLYTQSVDFVYDN